MVTWIWINKQPQALNRNRAHCWNIHCWTIIIIITLQCTIYSIIFKKLVNGGAFKDSLWLVHWWCRRNILVFLSVCGNPIDILFSNHLMTCELYKCSEEFTIYNMKKSFGLRMSDQFWMRVWRFTLI
jgi:hypothetical protein